MVDSPLFPIPLDRIVPPVLHIPLGLFGDVFKCIQNVTKKIDLAEHFCLNKVQMEACRSVTDVVGKFD